MRGTISRLFAAILLTVSIGVQVLEATGRWDRTFQDSGDEAVLVAVVFCIGAAVLLAGAVRPRVSLSRVDDPIGFRLATALTLLPRLDAPSFSSSPPLSLRV